MDKNNTVVRKKTIYDVAKLAGTSATTVSRVLNNVDYPVKKELQDRITDAALKLNYSPNILAKSLKSMTSRDIGVIVPTISNVFYSSVIFGIEREISRYDYNILLCNSFRDPEKERKYLQSLYEKQVKGIILSPLDRRNVKLYREKGMQFVLIDQKLDEANCSSINVDCCEGAFSAVEYMISQGHKKIAFVSSPMTKWSRKQTFKGYKDALKKYGIKLKDEYLLISEEREEEIDEDGFEHLNGKRQADIFLNDNLDATAVMAVNDMTAFAFMQQLQLRGVRLPEDISVIGFDDITFSKLLTPALTTVRYPANEVGRLAGKLIIDKVQDMDSENVTLNLQPKLIIRNSVKSLL